MLKAEERLVKSDIWRKLTEMNWRASEKTAYQGIARPYLKLIQRLTDSSQITLTELDVVQKKALYRWCHGTNANR